METYGGPRCGLEKYSQQTAGLGENAPALVHSLVSRLFSVHLQELQECLHTVLCGIDSGTGFLILEEMQEKEKLSECQHLKPTMRV